MLEYNATVTLKRYCVFQGLVTLLSNPVIADAVAGLATSATAFAAVERVLLFQMRNATVAPFGETVQQVFSKISALRDSLDGPQVRSCLSLLLLLLLLLLLAISRSEQHERILYA